MFILQPKRDPAYCHQVLWVVEKESTSENERPRLCVRLQVWWWRQAAAQGSAMAECNLGCLHYEGLGVAKDLAAAHRLLRSAAAKGDLVALDALTSLSWAELDPASAELLPSNGCVCVSPLTNEKPLLYDKNCLFGRCLFFFLK